MRWQLVASFTSGEEGDWQPVSSSAREWDFLIGADGRDSRVRAALGIEMVDVRSPATFAMFELPSSSPPSSEMILALTDGLASAMIPLSGGQIRWGFELESPRSEVLYSGDLSALLARHAPWYEGEISRVDWGRVIRFERRLVRRFGKDRVCGNGFSGSTLASQARQHAPDWLTRHARRIVPALPASGPDLDPPLEQLGVVIR